MIPVPYNPYAGYGSNEGGGDGGGGNGGFIPSGFGHHGHSHFQGSQSEAHAPDGEDENEIVESTLSELVPGAAIRNLLVRVTAVKEPGEADLASAHGTCKLVYDVEKLSPIVREGATLRITDGFGFSQESGCLVIRLEDPETESVVVEMNVDDDDVTPPPEQGSRNISTVSRVFGLLVIRENRCLLCPAGFTQGKFSFPVAEADGDEPDRTAALRAFQSITDIDINEVYLLHEVAPVMSYEEDFVATLFVAYSRRPFKKNKPPTNTETYSWFTFDEAAEALETDASKECLWRAADAVEAAVGAGYVNRSFGVPFGSYNASSTKTTITSVPQPVDTKKEKAIEEQSSPSLAENSDIEALLARTSALFYLAEKNAISKADFANLLQKMPTSGEQLQTSSSFAVSQSTKAQIKTEQKSVSFTKDAIPVTVLCGFLGSGKTTLVNHLMLNRQNMKIALIVNDMAEVNIDAKSIANKVDDKVVEITNGCICCTLREDLLTEIRRLAETGKYDCIVVESTGIGDPMGIAETFTFPLDDGRILNDIAKLDTLVTVVDASQLMVCMNLKGKKTDDESGKLSKLLTEQIEFADVILLNKLDLVAADEMNKVRGIVNNFNPRARKIECIHSAVALSDVLNTNLFSFEQAESSPGWLKTLRGEEVPESEEFGIGSVVWRAQQPLSPRKLKLVLESSPFTDAMIRSKGVIWLGNREGSEHSIEWAGTGHTYSFFAGKDWSTNGSSGSKPKGICELVLIGFFDDKSVPEKAMQMLNDSLIKMNEDGSWEIEEDDPSNPSIRVISDSD